MIFIDYKDASPIYEQVVERFKTLILRGVLVPDEKIPSVRNLAVELSINPNTIQRAYAELEKQGYIYTVKGKGNFVADLQAARVRKRILTGSPQQNSWHTWQKPSTAAQPMRGSMSN